MFGLLGINTIPPYLYYCHTNVYNSATNTTFTFTVNTDTLNNLFIFTGGTTTSPAVTACTADGHALTKLSNNTGAQGWNATYVLSTSEYGGDIPATVSLSITFSSNVTGFDTFGFGGGKYPFVAGTVTSGGGTGSTAISVTANNTSTRFGVFRSSPISVNSVGLGSFVITGTAAIVFVTSAGPTAGSFNFGSTGNTFYYSKGLATILG